MKQVDEKYFINPEQYIPIGCYCYDENGICPFWDKDETKDIQKDGYCHYLKRSDFDINSEGGTIIDMKTNEEIKLDYYPFGGLLWDQCKECGIKNYEKWCLDCKYMANLEGYYAHCKKHNKKIDVEKDYCESFELHKSKET